jgi:hypothetical protein
VETTDEGTETKTLRIDRVMRAHEVTEEGPVVITFQAGGALFRVEMSLDHAEDLADGLARSAQRVRARPS